MTILKHIGAIDAKNELITQMGKDMKNFPVHPR
jgi:HrpA-like RNA helicase